MAAPKKASSKASTKVDDSYDSSALEALSPQEQVRRRPGMWIGNTGQKGLHHMVYEIVDNSVDEFMAGHGDKIEVTVSEDNWVTVRDHARGIPVDKHKESGLTGVELVLTRIGGGGKYGQEGSGYKVSGGLHGVGSSVVNFLSSDMRAHIRRGGYEWTMDFARGEKKAELKKGKKTTASGTEISFLYDEDVFDADVRYERETLERRLRELAYLNPGLTLELTFKGGKTVSFYAEGGLADYMKALLSDRDGIEPVHKMPIMLSGSVTEEVEAKSGKKKEDTTFIDVALFWSTAQNESWHAFTNAISNPDGGTHYDGLRAGLRRALNEAAEELGKFRAKDEPFEQADTREGLFSAILVKVADPQFEGQTKGKLNNPEVQKRVSDFVYRELLEWMTAKENKAQAERIIARAIEARDGRLAARKARKAVTERKGLLGGSGLPGKLADCRTRDREKTEIFIVEGDSAGGGMKKARDSSTQAIMPLRGKIQNAEKAGEATLSSQAIQDILAAIGGVVTDVKVQIEKGGKTINRTKLVVDVSEPRYGKVVIACDADVDGGHIVTLLLTFFYRYAPDLIREGRLYIADLPLYRVEHKKEGRLYLYSDDELNTLNKKKMIRTRPDGSPDVMRFKGLGEMQPEQLGETALNPETRRLLKVVIEDEAEAEDITTLLMGSRVDRRREYIEENALSVEADI
jgi:DNA gyrase subunit B